MTILLLITLGAFLARSRDLVGYVQLGQGDDRRPRNWGRKLKDLIVVYFGQRKLLQWTIPGVMHFLIFWGFIILGSTIVEAFAIRKIQRPGRFRGSHMKEADYILYAITGIMLTILFVRGAEISLGHFPYPTEGTPVSDATASLFEGLSLGAREALDTVFLWWHSL